MLIKFTGLKTLKIKVAERLRLGCYVELGARGHGVRACVFQHLISSAMRKANLGLKSPGAIYSGQRAEWQTSLNQPERER